MNIKAKTETNLKIKLNLEPAFQTIYLSSIFISFCVAVVSTTTIESLNWGTILFLLLAIILLYLKKETYLTINEEELEIRYFAGIKTRIIDLGEINDIVIMNPGGKASLTTADHKVIVFYLNKNNQQIFFKQLEKLNVNIKKQIMYSEKD